MIQLSRTRRIDWARMIEHLRSPGIGMSWPDLADALGVSRTSVQDYCDDRHIEPAFWVGSTLLLLWSEKTGLPWIEAPVRDVPESVSRIMKAMA